MKLPTTIIYHANILQQKNKNLFECTLLKRLLVVTSLKKLGYAYLKTTAGASRMDGLIFLSAKYNVFRNRAVISWKVAPAPIPKNQMRFKIRGDAGNT